MSIAAENTKNLNSSALAKLTRSSRRDQIPPTQARWPRPRGATMPAPQQSSLLILQKTHRTKKCTVKLYSLIVSAAQVAKPSSRATARTVIMVPLVASDDGGRRRWWLSTAPTGRLEGRPARSRRRVHAGDGARISARGCCPPLSHNLDGRRTHTHAFVRHAIRLRRPQANTRMGDWNLDGRAGADGSLLCARSCLFAWGSATEFRVVAALRMDRAFWSLKRREYATGATHAVCKSHTFKTLDRQ